MAKSIVQSQIKEDLGDVLENTSDDKRFKNENNDLSFDKLIKTFIDCSCPNYVTEDALKFLTEEISFFIKNIIIKSKKLKMRCKRSKLFVKDIQLVCKNQTVFNVLGYNYYSQNKNMNPDQDIDLDEIISRPLPKIPQDIGIRCHWLAINGLQPLISENAVQHNANNISLLTKKTNTAQISDLKSDVNLFQSHRLSVEQQLFYKEMTESIVGLNENRRVEALSWMATESGLWMLLPHFIAFIIEGIRVNILSKSLSVIVYLQRMTKAILDNKNFTDNITIQNNYSLWNHVHQLIPTLLSCALSYPMFCKPETDNHWLVREQAAKLIALLTRSFEAFNRSNIHKKILDHLNDLYSKDQQHNSIGSMQKIVQKFGFYVCYGELSLETFDNILKSDSFLKEINNNTLEVIEINALDNLYALLAKYLMCFANQNKLSSEDQLLFYRQYPPNLVKIITERLSKNV